MGKVIFKTSGGTDVTFTDRTDNGIDSKDTIKIGNGAAITVGSLANHPEVQKALNDLGIFPLPAAGTALKNLRNYVAAFQLYDDVRNSNDCDAIPNYAYVVRHTGQKIGYTAEEIRNRGVLTLCPGDAD